MTTTRKRQFSAKGLQRNAIKTAVKIVGFTVGAASSYHLGRMIDAKIRKPLKGLATSILGDTTLGLEGAKVSVNAIKVGALLGGAIVLHEYVDGQVTSNTDTGKAIQEFTKAAAAGMGVGGLRELGIAVFKKDYLAGVPGSETTTALGTTTFPQLGYDQPLALQDQIADEGYFESESSFAGSSQYSALASANDDDFDDNEVFSGYSQSSALASANDDFDDNEVL